MSRRAIRLCKQAGRNGVHPENYLHYRNATYLCDKYLEECTITLQKPITPAEREKIIAKKAELKRLEKEKAIKEHEEKTGQTVLDRRKLNLRKKKTYADEYDPDYHLDPWFM